MYEIIKVNDFFFMGNCIAARSAETLKKFGITVVCNLTEEDYGLDREGFVYRQFNQMDGHEITKESIDQYLKWMDEQIANDGTIFIHCFASLSRTPSYLIAYLMYKAGANSETDLKKMWSEFEDKLKGLNPNIHPHWRLKKSIIGYFDPTQTVGIEEEKADSIYA